MTVVTDGRRGPAIHVNSSQSNNYNPLTIGRLSERPPPPPPQPRIYSK
jgi:hypothetical protein